MSFDRLFWIGGFVLVLVIGMLDDKPAVPPHPYTNEIEVSVDELEREGVSEPLQTGSLKILGTGITLDANYLTQMLARANGGGVYVYDHKTAGEYVMSAEGIDKRQYLVNSYLEGYAPFEVDNIFLPLVVLAARKTYQYDYKQYWGRQEVWQSSRQSFFYPRGDCEDHAIALADWLIEMGEDARVVLGTVRRGEGHAWVVLIREETAYLLEATQKQGVSGLKSYPLAEYQTDYHPAYMFNRDYFWVNRENPYFTTGYVGGYWKQKSRYIPQGASIDG